MKSNTCRTLKYEQGYSMTDHLRVRSKSAAYLTSIRECNSFIRLNCILPPLKAGMQEESTSSQSFFCNLSCMSTQWKTCLSWQWQHNWTESTRRALRALSVHRSATQQKQFLSLSVHREGTCFLPCTCAALQLLINATWAAVTALLFACAGTIVWDENHFQFIWVMSITN